ncbi:MAB_1171c family putative transporter [Amycolatopsis aidingensis]|uniref:MAB_1171c family putative transporter n=1 Tax=Amycolatopsis aidingensis TaxID=2842453 RepID=UPI001C0D445B|nr:MAB_1171c family putative transporter [Amycolatopsis aidingensis]
MISILFILVALIAFLLAALAFLRRRRGPRKPTQVPMIVILLALGAAFFFLAPAVQAVESRIIPSLGRLLSNLCTLTAAYGFLTLMRYVSHPPAQARAHSRWRLGALLVALAVLVVTFLLSRVPEGTGIFTGLYREQPTLAVYTLVYSAYLGVALVDLGWLGVGTIRHARGYLRAGMILVFAGCLLGLAYVGQKVVSVLGEVFGAGTPAEALCAGPFSTVGCTFAVGMPALSVLAIILGAAVPALGPRVTGLLRWPGRWRAYRRLHPLWQALYQAAPEIALTSPQAVQGDAPPHDIGFRLYRRVIEIRDGLLILAPYRDQERTAAHRRSAEAAGLTGADLDAAVEAADIAEALRRKQAGLPATGEDARREPAVESDLAAETAWLTRVARAFGTAGRSDRAATPG